MESIFMAGTLKDWEHVAFGALIVLGPAAVVLVVLLAQFLVGLWKSLPEGPRYMGVVARYGDGHRCGPDCTDCR